MRAAGRRVCVIGAGSAGLAAARNFREVGFDVDIIEREHELGGLWNYSSPAGRVYKSATMISSKPFTQFPDFPMPEEYPDYPSHDQVLAYLRSYAMHFKLDALIRYDLSVEEVRSRDDTSWDVTLSDGSTARYDAVVVANGHNSVPRYPDFAGEFSGRMLHSADFKTPDSFAGESVLVVGRGNSGCDVAVEIMRTAARVFSSGRRGYHFVPRYFAGIPSDQVGDAFLRRKMPLEARRKLAVAAIESEIGQMSDSGLPMPDHELYASHPVINTSFPLAVKEGRIVPKPDIQRLLGSTVQFVDGSHETIDSIVFATGYRLELPFLEEEDGPIGERWEPLLNVFHPKRETLFFAGYIQPDSGQFGLVHWQMRAAALFAVKDERRDVMQEVLDQAVSTSQANVQIEYIDTPRHLLEVEHWSYLNTLRDLSRRLEQ